MRSRSHQGFTLIELAVVITIIGLLIGGVMGAQNLVRSTRVKSVGIDVLADQSAAKGFKDRFKAWPGDMLNATDEWGIIAGTTGNDATCFAATSMGSIKTCNGNGNNQIDTYNESFRFWQHLANAGLIVGNFSGIPGSVGNWDSAPGINIPVTKLTGVGITVGYLGAFAGNSTVFAETGFGNYFQVGARNSTTGQTTDPAFSPPELQNLDSKLDDGLPGTGNFIGAPWGNCTNAATNADIGTGYKLTSTTVACYFIYRNAF